MPQVIDASLEPCLRSSSLLAGIASIAFATSVRRQPALVRAFSQLQSGSVGSAPLCENVVAPGRTGSRRSQAGPLGWRHVCCDLRGSECTANGCASEEIVIALAGAERVQIDTTRSIAGKSQRVLRQMPRHGQRRIGQEIPSVHGCLDEKLRLPLISSGSCSVRCDLHRIPPAGLIARERRYADLIPVSSNGKPSPLRPDTYLRNRDSPLQTRPCSF